MTDSKNEQEPLLPGISAVDLTFGQPWKFITPGIYRYEDQKWIDHFFETGTLRLSTFRKFATYEDEQRGDQSEGFAVCYGETTSSASIITVVKHEPSIFVFCGTHRLDKLMRTKFQRDAAFQITNTIGFSLEISRQLLGFKSGFEGSCIYRPSRKIERKIDFDHNKLFGDNGFSALASMANAFTGPEILLLKAKKHEAQAEYRFVWEVDTFEGDYIDIVAPLARQYCRKVKNDEYDD